MEGHSEGPVNTLTCLSVDLILYHRVRRWLNIKPTLSQRFVFEWNCNCYFNCQYCSTHNVSTIHIKHEILLQYWANVYDAGPAFKHY